MMPDHSPKDRYRIAGNSEARYADDQQLVLVNKLGITELEPLEQAEVLALASADEVLFSEVREATPMTCDLLRHIHFRIFGKLYEWAGRWRTVQISKPGVLWPPPDFLDQAMEEIQRTVLKRFPAAALENDDHFCAAAGEIMGEFLAIHPFREVNARTIKALVDLLSVQTGRPLLVYDMTDAGREGYIHAARRALTKDYESMKAAVRGALAAARRS